MNSANAIPADTESIKGCCARLYESDVARLLLGESFHPGGLRLTERLGTVLGLNAQSKVLDVASGKGASAIFFAERFGCEVEGIDYSAQNVEQATIEAAGKGLSARLRFRQADAERLPFDNSSFDTVICECAFCTFPNKTSAAREFARVLRQGGAVGLSDLTRASELPTELDGLLAWAACIADAQPLESYKAQLVNAGLRISDAENHDGALTEMVQQVRLKLLSVEIAAGLKKLELPNIDLTAAKTMAKVAIEATRQGKLGYSIICGVKP
jgi:arsenite methyltransferase